MLKNIQGWEFIVILVIVMLLFGAKKLPDLARSLGSSAKEFRKGMDEGEDGAADDVAAKNETSDPS